MVRHCEEPKATKQFSGAAFWIASLRNDEVCGSRASFDTPLRGYSG